MDELHGQRRKTDDAQETFVAELDKVHGGQRQVRDKKGGNGIGLHPVVGQEVRKIAKVKILHIPFLPGRFIHKRIDMAWLEKTVEVPPVAHAVHVENIFLERVRHEITEAVGSVVRTPQGIALFIVQDD
jgi:hypothetical protein